MGLDNSYTRLRSSEDGDRDKDSRGYFKNTYLSKLRKYSSGSVSTNYCYSFLYYILLSIIGVLLFLTGSIYHPVGNRFPIGPQQEDLALGVEGFVPTFPIESRDFHYNKAFADSDAELVEDKWASMIPMGRGWIRLPILNEFDNPFYNIAVYHQLHCLFALRQSYFTLLRLTEETEQRGNTINATRYAKHANHCFELLRNQLTCSVDVTLEPVKPGQDGTKVWGTAHKCRDFGKVSQWAEKVRSSNNKGIGSFPDN